MSDDSQPCFKRSTFDQPQPGGKKKVWKGLKQILQTEKMLPWPENAVTCKFQWISYQ